MRSARQLPRQSQPMATVGQGGNTMNNLENKHRKQRIELANNLTLAAVTVTAIVNTIAVILKIAR